MVKLNKIYTRTGDDGTTGLVQGPRRKKHDIRVDAYGEVDETNAILGRVRLHTADLTRMDQTLNRIQNDLFDLGADLATPGESKKDVPALRITDAQVDWLETEIDFHNDLLQPLTSFILPGGTALAADLHVARTISRRAERRVAALMDAEPDTNPVTMRYLNRLSDLLFVLARIANNNGRDDVLWTPGQYSSDDKPTKQG